MAKYTILRDMSRQNVAGPFEAAISEREGAAPSSARIEVESLDKRDIRTLARDPQVRAIAPVMPVTLVRPVDMEGAQPEPQAAATGATWGVQAVGADVSTRTGSGVTVCVLDTGIDAGHQAFSGVTLVQKDFTGSGDGDKQGHGTHCAGTIFGRDVDGTRIGVARGVTRALIGKVLGDDGSGSTDGILSGIQWAAVEQNAHVISMSIGIDLPGFVRQQVEGGMPADLAASAALQAYRANVRAFDALMEMIRSREVFENGSVIVAAAGNASRRQVNPDFEIGVEMPAAADGVISVAALQQPATALRVAPFSNTFANISAPGVGVVSARLGGGLLSLSGTSMAAPHVAGIAALWWEQILTTAVPATTARAAVVAKLLASATTNTFAPGVDPADRGVGLVQAP
ncbi:Subtilase family protein [Actinoplanes philippinensis]|uniref:Subtilase family protein n=2 Tax=Actinoplanes philippinensis TaxID=35752 RepID=A0A1I2A6R3_9ACTN|nr:Subtilase family protein [Actinoplanes philippinensis]